MLQPIELFFAGYLSDSLLAKFPGDLGKQDNPHSRAAGGGKDVEDKPGMVMRDEANYEEIVSKGKYEKGRVENAEDKRAKIAKVKQKMKKRAKPMRHERLFLRSERSGTRCKLMRFKKSSRGCFFPDILFCAGRGSLLVLRVFGINLDVGSGELPLGTGAGSE